MRERNTSTCKHVYEFGAATVFVHSPATGIFDGLIRGNFRGSVHPVGGGPVASMEIKTFYAWMAANEAMRQYKILREDGNQ